MSACKGRYDNNFTEFIIALACTNLITLIAVFPRSSVTNAPCSSNSCFVLSLTWIICAEKKEPITRLLSRLLLLGFRIQNMTLNSMNVHHNPRHALFKFALCTFSCALHAARCIHGVPKQAISAICKQMT